MSPFEIVSVVFSSLALAGQIWSWIARRGRLKVTARIASAAIAEDGGFRNRLFVLVEVRSLGRPNGVERVDVEWREDPGEWSKTPADPIAFPGLLQAAGPPSVADVGDVFKVRRLLAEHEMATWSFRISTGREHNGVDRPRDLRAVVRLVNGKEFHSEYVTLFPDDVGAEEASK